MRLHTHLALHWFNARSSLRTLWIEIDKLWMFKNAYHRTLAASTQIVYKNVEVLKQHFFQRKTVCEGK
jgi:hypothetical protein